jgi:hypothetical protein
LFVSALYNSLSSSISLSLSLFLCTFVSPHKHKHSLFFSLLIVVGNAGGIITGVDDEAIYPALSRFLSTQSYTCPQSSSSSNATSSTTPEYPASYSPDVVWSTKKKKTGNANNEEEEEEEEEESDIVTACRLSLRIEAPSTVSGRIGVMNDMRELFDTESGDIKVQSYYCLTFRVSIFYLFQPPPWSCASTKIM